MALTTDELRLQDAAKLERLISELMSARRVNDMGQLDDILEQLVDFQASTPFTELQRKAGDAQSAAAAAITKVALEELSKISDETTAAGAGFKAAAMIAENGKKELLFPSLAAASARGMELMKQFQEAIESVSATIDNVDELGDVPQAVDDLLVAFGNLKVKINDADSSLAARNASTRRIRSKKKSAKRKTKKKTTRRQSTKKIMTKKKGKKKTAAKKKTTTRKKSHKRQ